MRFDESLREVPVDVNELSVAIRQAQSLLQHVESDDQNVRSAIELLGYLGNACRVTGRSDESIQYLERAVSLCRKVGDAKGTVVNTIRLAEATEAIGFLEESLRLREEKGDQALIESTQMALTTARQMSRQG